MSINAFFPDKMTVTAHTGCENTPENSLACITKANEVGADIIETDVRFNRNNIPILSHDITLCKRPTLEQAFQTLSQYPGLMMNIDIKNTKNLKAISELAAKYKLKDRIFYTGIGENFVGDVRRQTPEVNYFLNCDIEPVNKQNETYFSALADKVIRLGAVGINPHFGNVSKDLIDYLHSRGLLVSVWTVNKAEDMLRMLDFGPDNITTRQPALLISLIKSKESEE